jgi:hypothetical protein
MGVMPTKSDFMAAEEIKAILHGRDKIEQERIIRWVTESLGLVATSSISLGNPPPPTAASTIPQPNVQLPGSSPQRSKDIKTFVNEKNPKRDVQFAAVAAYFYRFECPERKEVIVPKDLDTAGRQARGYGFKAPLTTLNNAVALGYFDRAGRGEFKLNAVGENLVAMTLPGSGAEAKGGKPRRARRPNGKVRARQSKAK